jgi:citrate lyase subunit gamma (acyl carrier protein)
MKSSAGTYESSDCLVTLEKNDTIEITIESIVFDQFGDQIQDVIKQTLQQHNIKTIKVDVFD